MEAAGTAAGPCQMLWLSLAGNLVYFLLLAVAVQWAGGAAASLIVGLIPVVVTLVGVREQGGAAEAAAAGAGPVRARRGTGWLGSADVRASGHRGGSA